MLHAVVCLTLSQVDMTPMLNRGPVVLVEEAKGGKFGQASAIVMIDAPVDAVWGALQKMDEFKAYMPKVTTSDVSKKTDAGWDLRIVLDVPGPDTDYTVRYTPDPATKTLEAVWQSGDLKGSRWFWKVEPGPGGKTLLTHTLAVRNFSGLAQSFEDDQQTITVGVNVASVIAAAKAVKRRCEEQGKASLAPVAAPVAAPGPSTTTAVAP